MATCKPMRFINELNHKHRMSNSERDERVKIEASSEKISPLVCALAISLINEFFFDQANAMNDFVPGLEIDGSGRHTIASRNFTDDGIDPLLDGLIGSYKVKLELSITRYE